MVLNPDKFKERTLYCPTCKQDYKAEGPAPNCPVCKNHLIEILHVGGRRITGVPNV
jgi:Zn finger protein HypA/HybF involved in hydrogenase expression